MLTHKGADIAPKDADIALKDTPFAMSLEILTTPDGAFKLPDNVYCSVESPRQTM